MTHITSLLLQLGLILILTTVLQARPLSRPQPEIVRSSKASLGFKSLPWGFNITNAQLQVNGTLPSWLSGSLYRNGPGLYPNIARPHWFDGFGYLQGFHFAAGEVTYNTHFVGSTPYNESRPTSAPVDPCKAVLGNAQSEYVPNLAKDRRSDGSPNTGVTLNEVNGVFLSNTASTVSNQFDPKTLGDVATPFVFGPNNDNLPGFSPEHRHVDPWGNLYHFGYVFGSDPSYMLYWIPSGTLTRKVLSVAPVVPQMSQPSYLHSFCLTNQFMVLSDIPVQIPLPLDWSKFRMAQGVPTTWRAFNRKTGHEVFNWTSPPFFMFHHINCYEDVYDNSIVVDLITYPDVTIMGDLYLDVLINQPSEVMTASWNGRANRYKLPMNEPGAVVEGTEISSFPAELPTINYDTYNTQPYRYFYAISVSSLNVDFFDQLIKVDAQMGTTTVWTQPNTYPGEPIFVAAPDAQAEGDGVVLSVVLDPSASGSFLLILNATTFTEIGRANTPNYAPFGFHGMYSYHN